MRYLKKALESDERPLCRASLHPIYLVSGFVWFACLSGLGWLGDAILWKYFGPYIEGVNISALHFTLTPGVFGWMMTGGGLYILLAEMVRLNSTDIVVTSKRLLYKTGFIKIKLNATGIDDILGVNIDQGWFGQFLGYGRLHMDCRFIEDVYIPFAKNPYGIMKAIDRARHAGHHAPAPMDEPASLPDPSVQPAHQTLIQITGNSPVYFVDKVPADDKAPLKDLPKALGDNMLSAFRRKA